jgi:benzodiazapine receptor
MKVVRLLEAVSISVLAGAIGSIFTISAIPTWYAGLNKPFFSLPNWLFAPVWTVLYILMGLALYLFWQTESTQEKKSGNLFFFTQLVLNALWSIVFFGLHSPLGGVGVIVLLWVMILLTIVSFSRVSKLASYLLWPYLAWVTFASALNIAVAVLN